MELETIVLSGNYTINLQYNLQVSYAFFSHMWCLVEKGHENKRGTIRGEERGNEKGIKKGNES
jgi:hypothetical protein